MKLRPYQLAAIEGVRKNWRSRPLLVAPTGSGKTTIAAAIAAQALAKGRTVLFVAHRVELLGQARERLPWGCEFASVFKRSGFPKADILIIDEAHRAAAASYGKLIESHEWECVIGLTATPYRLDGQGLDKVFGSIVVVTTPRQLMDEGFLMEPRLFVGRTLPDLGTCKRRGADYDPDALDEIMSDDGIVADVVDSARKHEGPAIIFASGVAHSKRLVEELGDRWAHIDAKTPAAERARILDDLKAGDLDGISNCQLLTEGWDFPAIRVCILARPTLSLSLYLQMVGRILRPYPGKARPIVLDHANNVITHGPPDAEVEFNLEGKPKRPKDAIPSLSTCLECYAIFIAKVEGGECPQCGAKKITKPRTVKATPGVMIEVDPAEVEAEWYARKLRAAIKQKCLVGWARAKFKERFGRWPKLDAIERGLYVVPGAAEAIEGSPVRYGTWKQQADHAMKTHRGPHDWGGKFKR